MIFDEFDRKMRVYEQSLDQCILPDLYIAARLDGRSFTRLTKEICRFEAPFDERFRDFMTHTVQCLMTNAGFRILYGYTESDEISLLFHPADNTFSRKVRKINTTLAGEASAAFSLALGQSATFDCRVIPLPNADRVADYFLWRQEDAHRNSLNAHCYWALRREDLGAREATRKLDGLSVPDKNELLFRRGINYDDLPNWQKRGIGALFVDDLKEGFNPIKQEKVTAVRRELKLDWNLPIGNEYRQYILKLLSTAAP